MQEPELTRQRVRAVWWLIVWRALVGGGLLGLVLGFVIGFVEGAMGMASETIMVSSSLAGWLASLVWGFVVIGMSLRKQYADFRLALLPLPRLDLTSPQP